jgi:hypothetical protein
MSLALIEQLFNAFFNLPGDVQIVIAVLTFVLIMLVLTSKKACDNCVRVIVAFRREQTPTK